MSVEAKRKEVDALRQQIRDAQVERSTEALGGVEEFKEAALDREAEHLRDQLATLQSRTADPTKAELMQEARDLDIPGRSSMDKDELAKAVAEQESTADHENWSGS